MIYRHHALFSDLLFLVDNELRGKRLYTGMLRHFRIIILQCLADSGIGNRAMLHQLAVLVPVVHHPVNIMGIFVELVKAQLKQYILEYQQTSGHTNSQSCDIDKGEDLVLFQVSPGDLEVIAEHGKRFNGWLREECHGLSNIGSA